jgi:hypothetical protein
MNACASRSLVAGALVAAAATAWGQGAGSLTADQKERLRSHVSGKDYLRAQAALEGFCDQHFAAARSRSNTIYQRAESANAAVRCVGEGRAALMAADADPDTRLRTRDLLAPMADEAARLKKQAESEVEFMGLSWGLGFGFSFSSDELVDDAEVVNGVVRMKSQKKQQPRAVMEMHKYFWCNKGYTDGKRGCGPFIAVAATADDVLSGVGFGFMYGYKRGADESGGFSVGVGAILDGNVKDLAEGFKVDQPLPPGETTVRFEDKARWSALVFATMTF